MNIELLSYREATSDQISTMPGTRVASPKASSNPHVQDAWQFVNLSESRQGKDADLRKLVRVNAMRDYRRRQKQRQSASTDHTSHNTPTTQFPSAPQPPAGTREVQPGDDTDDALLREAFSGWPGELEQELVEFQAISVPLGRVRAPGKQERDSHRDASASFVPKRSPRHTSVNVSPISILGSGNKDPFNMYPVSGWSRRSELLDHCK